MHIPGADAQLPVFHQSQDHLGSAAVGNGVNIHIGCICYTGDILGAHAGAGDYVGGRYIEAQVVHLDPALVVLQLAPDIDAVCGLLVLLNGHGSVLNQGVHDGVVQAGAFVHIQSTGADGAGQRGQLDRIALHPTGNAADGGLIPGDIVHNGPVRNHKGISIHQSQELLVAIFNSR